MINIILGLLIGAVIVRAVVICIRNKKNGNSCGCGCSSCSGCVHKKR